MSTTESLLQARFGPEALVTRLGAIWMVHVDQLPGKDAFTLQLHGLRAQGKPEAFLQDPTQ